MILVTPSGLGHGTSTFEEATALVRNTKTSVGCACKSGSIPLTNPSSMPFTFACSCGQALHADKQLAGSLVGCPACGATVSVPRIGIVAKPELPQARTVARPEEPTGTSSFRGQPASRVSPHEGLPLTALEEPGNSARDIAAKLAAASGLGSFLSEYRESTSYRVIWLLGFPVLYAVLAARMARSWGNEPWFSPVAVGGGIILTLIVAVAILAVLVTSRWRAHAFLSTTGMVRVQGSRAECCRWAMIKEVRNDRQQGQVLTTQTLVLTLLDGREWTFTDVKDFDAFLADVQSQTGPVLMERAWRQYQGGQTVWFGKVGIDGQGIVVPGLISGQRQVAWREIKQITQDGGVMQIIPHTGWSKITIGETESIPNGFVLLRLVEHLHRHYGA